MPWTPYSQASYLYHSTKYRERNCYSKYSLSRITIYSRTPAQCFTKQCNKWSLCNLHLQYKQGHRPADGGTVCIPRGPKTGSEPLPLSRKSQFHALWTPWVQWQAAAKWVAIEKKSSTVVASKVWSVPFLTWQPALDRTLAHWDSSMLSDESLWCTFASRQHQLMRR